MTIFLSLKNQNSSRMSADGFHILWFRLVWD